MPLGELERLQVFWALEEIVIDIHGGPVYVFTDHHCLQTLSGRDRLKNIQRTAHFDRNLQ